ncbi:MAG: hypothetical protein AAGK23_04945, partial [Pseudomonadota bacterium]
MTSATLSARTSETNMADSATQIPTPTTATGKKREIKADICIIGAGSAGLSTAYAAANLGLNTAPSKSTVF